MENMRLLDISISASIIQQSGALREEGKVLNFIKINAG